MLTTENLMAGALLVDARMEKCTLVRWATVQATDTGNWVTTAIVRYEDEVELPWNTTDLFATVHSVEMAGSTSGCWLTCWDGPRTAHYTNAADADRRFRELSDASPDRVYQIVEQPVADAWWLTPLDVVKCVHCRHELAADDHVRGCPLLRTDQQVWERAVRAELVARGYDPTEVETEVEGFGQDFAEYATASSPVTDYADAVLDEFLADELDR